MIIRYKLYLIRHGATKGNLERRYVGRTDEPLLEKSREVFRNKFREKALPEPDILLASPMKRCVETAELLFPNAQLRRVDGLRECDFGRFEYMNCEELNGNPVYQRYIDSGGETAFPGGEDPKEFQDRCVRAFAKAMQAILSEETRGKKQVWERVQAETQKETKEDAPRVLALVVHGGTIMALMNAFARPHRDYFDWHVGNGEGYETWLDCSRREEEKRWEFLITDSVKIISLRNGN